MPLTSSAASRVAAAGSSSETPDLLLIGPASPVSRAEVRELFDSWKNSPSATSDSGLEPGSSSGQQSSVWGGNTSKQEGRQVDENKLGGHAKERRARRGAGAKKGSSSMSGQGQDAKLPRLGGRKATQQSLYSQQASQMEEKRRFVTVVRPLSFFPEPAPPPNFTPVVNNNRASDGAPVKGRPPSPAPFSRQMPLPQSQRPRAVPHQTANGDFSLSGNGYGSASLRLQLVGGGSGWDLTAIKRGYNGAAAGQYRNNYRSPDRSHYPGRYPPYASFDAEEKISMPPWNPHFGYSKVLSQQNYPLTDDWRRHIDARRRALQRKRTKRRTANDGTAFIGTPERFQHGAAQTEDDFEELVRRAGDVEAAAQTEMSFEPNEKAPVDSSACVFTPSRLMQDSATQVTLGDLPEFDAMVEPAVDQIVNQTVEQAFVEVMEEEEIKEIRRRRVEFQQMRMAELTTSKLMDISLE